MSKGISNVPQRNVFLRISVTFNNCKFIGSDFRVPEINLLEFANILTFPFIRKNQKHSKHANYYTLTLKNRCTAFRNYTSRLTIYFARLFREKLVIFYFKLT